jgi:hypothetical protein
MKKGVKLFISILSFIFILLLVVLVNAGIFQDNIQGDFNGIFNNTFYNSSGFIQMNLSIPGTNQTNVTNGTEMTGNENGLVSYWRMNESSWTGVNGEVKDVLGKNNGTARNNASISIGILGNAGNFSGAAGTSINEIQIANSNSLNPGIGSFTITGWAKSSARGGNGYQLYVAKRDNVTGGKNGYYIGLLEGSGIKFVVGDGTNRVDTAYVNTDYTKWFYFAAVINRTSNQSLIYINGTLGASASISTVGNINNSWNLSIGNDEGQALLGTTYQYPVKGQIDEVAIWNRALNSFEILELYNKGLNSSSNSSTNSTYFYNGTYESNVKDAGSIVSWDNITWNYGQITNVIINASNPVLLAHLEESSGAIIDSSMYSNNGTNNGASYSVSGKVNFAMSFDGVNDYVDFGNPTQLQITKNITLSSWVKFNQIPSGTTVMSIISKNEGGGYGIIANENLVGGTGRLVTYFYINGAYKNAGINLSSLSSGVWYHVLAAYNGTNVDFYLNGIKQESVSATGTISNVSLNLFIGANPGPGGTATEFFNGTIDEVYVFNRSLNSSEIASLSGNTSSNSGLKFQLRTSNDNSTWTEYKGNDGTSFSYYETPGNLNLSNSRYLQYRAYFSDILSKLYNVSLGYDIVSGLSVSLNSPVDNYLSGYINSINVTCSASSNVELSNATVYHNKSGFGWVPQEPAIIVSGVTNTTVFTLNEINSAVSWNCYFCDINNVCKFANNNRTIVADIIVPIINLVSPSEGYFENSSSSLNFVFNATDNRATNLSCKLFMDNNEVASNSSVLGGVNTLFSMSLSNGNYSWKINCSDGINSVFSEERNLSVNISSGYTPFWAKANTHTHTTNSDGDSPPSTVISLYQNKGYNILAITDHGYVTNCTPFTNSSFICIKSEEWTSTKHVVRINVSAPYNNAAINIQNAVNAAQNEGGFAIAAHPNWTSTTWTVAELTSLQNYTAMEIYNKVIERLTPDPYSVQKWDEVLKTGKKIFGVAADDMHQVNVDLGYGWTKVYMPEFTPQAYIESMKTGRFYSSQGPNMDSMPFSLVCDAYNTYNMGESANCSAISVNTTVSATNSSFTIKNITLIKDGVSINALSCTSQNCSLSYLENVSSSGYYRLEAIDSGNKKMWSNPIWITKIALPVSITVDSPENNSGISDYTPLINISLNQQTNLWYNINGGNNVTLCIDCSSYTGYARLNEGNNILTFYANNSDNIIKENKIYSTLNFNKSISEDFSDNSSIYSASNVYWVNRKMSLGTGAMFGDFILKTIITSNNITSFTVTWEENNTQNAKGEGQRTPIILKYRFKESSWIYTDSQGNYIVNGSSITDLNSNNLSLMFDFEKNPLVPIDLLNFRITWTEFTVPLISNLSASSITSNSAIISWDTDLSSNSSIIYGTTTSLGSLISLNESATKHSMTITGLDPSTGYFYKVRSCTPASCSQSPQDPYTPYSFTTQSIVVNPPSGSSSGGSGGGSIITKKTTTQNKTASLFVSEIGNLIARGGDKKTLSLNVKNTGDIFLNNCRLTIEGDIKSWLYSESTKGIAPGEGFDFTFTLNIPEEIEPKDYSGFLGVKCDEASNNKKMIISIPKESEGIKIIKASQEKNSLNVEYSIEGNLFEEEKLVVDLWIIDANGSEISRIKDSFNLKKETIKRTVSLQLPQEISDGVYSLYFAASSNPEETFKKNIALRSSITGKAVYDENPGKFGIYIIFLLIIVAGIFFAIRKNKKNQDTEIKKIKYKKKK